MEIRRILHKFRYREFPDFFAKRKLLRGLQEISQLSLEEMRDEEILVDVIRRIGLSYEPRDVYGNEAAYMNLTHNGLWQIPQQISKALITLSDHKIESFLEVGTHSGYTYAVISAYLFRLNSNLKALSVDPANYFRHYSALKTVLPIDYRHCTSDDLKGDQYDCVLIDGNHSYKAVKQDFENVGQHARVCMFHDINDDMVGFDHVPKFWKELVASNAFKETHEFLDCAEGKRVMGIGVGIK